MRRLMGLLGMAAVALAFLLAPVTHLHGGGHISGTHSRHEHRFVHSHFGEHTLLPAGSGLFISAADHDSATPLTTFHLKGKSPLQLPALVSARATVAASSASTERQLLTSPRAHSPPEVTAAPPRSPPF